MEKAIITPVSAGQICKIMNPLEDENPEDIYIVSEDPSPFEMDDSIYVTNLKDLQRNKHKPQFVPQTAIVKGDLIVVANNLEEFINSWNKL